MKITGPGAGGILDALPRDRRTLAIALCVVAWTLLAATLGAATQATGFWGTVVRPLLQAGVDAPGRWLRSRMVTPVHLDLDVKFEDWQKLSFQRDKAVREQALFASEDDYVPAVIRTGDQDLKVKLRLKGDSAAHLQGEKWSFRVDIKGEDTLFGMHRLSLQDPGTRNYIGEWVYHRALLREDILGLKYQFVDVSVNGKHLGIYSIEEHFDKPLIEQNQRRFGPILRLDEELLWLEAHQQLRPFGAGGVSGAGSYEASTIDSFRTNAVLEDKGTRALYLKAVSLLERFRRGELPVAEVFDARRLATYFALVDLLGAEHGARWHNIRFYFNPITSRLEPIGFDAECKPTTALQGVEGRELGRDGRWQVLYRPLNERLFADRAFHAMYLGEVERMSKPEYLDRLLAELGPGLEESLAILHREFPQIDSPEALFRRNQGYMRSMLEPAAALRVGLKVQEGNRLALEAASIQAMPVEIVAVEYGTGTGTVRAELPQPLYLAGRSSGTLPRFLPLEVAAEDAAKIDPASLRVLWRVPGTQAVHAQAAVPYVASADVTLLPDPTRRVPNLERFPFIRLDAAARVAEIQPGEWTLTESLVVPAGTTLRAGPGTTLDLREHAMIFSHGPLEWLGSAEAPVVLRSGDGTGQGLVVMQARSQSTLEHVLFDRLASPATEGYSLTGSVTFFESPVDITASEFARNDSEDAFNVVRGRVRVHDTLFRDTRSDAFDCDFCTGEFVDTRFQRLGNDGIDVSGADLRVERMHVDGARDKGLSVGEGSRVEASDIVVIGANAGIASKDRSELHARNITIKACRYSLVALVKKAEFGASKMYVDNVRLEDMERRDLIDENVLVVQDGVRLAPTGDQKEIWEMLYGENAPGRSIR